MVKEIENIKKMTKMFNERAESVVVQKDQLSKQLDQEKSTLERIQKRKELLLKQFTDEIKEATGQTIVLVSE